MEQNKTGKYLKYAIGEIILVVIGILIALQINNWNEQRNDNKKVKIAINAIYHDLVKDSILIHDELPYVKNVFDNNTNLLKKAYASSTDQDSLVKMMKEDFNIRWWTFISYNHNSFDNLKSGSTFELLPESIKLSLSEYYTESENYNVISQQYYQQYRVHLDEFVKTYNIIGRLHDPNYNESYLYNATWENINPKHFMPLVATVIGGYQVLYRNALNSLKESQERIRILLPKLEPYLENSI